MSDEIRVGRRSVRLTHPERVLYPADGVTKGDLAQYYPNVREAGPYSLHMDDPYGYDVQLSGLEANALVNGPN